MKLNGLHSTLHVRRFFNQTPKSSKHITFSLRFTPHLQITDGFGNELQGIEKLAHFRVKDLKDILTQLGLSKQGKKQDLADRILTIISDDRVSGMWAKKSAVKKEDVAKLVDDMHRKLQALGGAADSVSKSQNVSNVTVDTAVTEEVEETVQIEKVRCLCGSTLQADSMIKCEDKKCNVLQHIGCVSIPEKPMDGIIHPTRPTTFYCELCRLAHADPFWVALQHPLYPVKLTIATVPTDGTSPMQNVVKTFQLTKADMILLAKSDFDVQAWCMLLNDKVSFRMQWPQYADLQVNGMPVRAINRPGSQLLGANGRDDGPVITSCIHVGSNKISLTGYDARVFCFGVRIVKRRTVQQILNLIPRESDGEKFEDALARVCRCVGGGAAKENDDSDSDLEVVSDSIPVNLRCPMSGSRMKIAGRFKPCVHMGCFDLEVFVQMNERSRKWQCPICLKNYALEDVIIDPYFTRITAKMRNCGEDVTGIEVKPDGCWRVKAEQHDLKSLGQLGQWHLPDGTLFVQMEVDRDGNGHFGHSTTNVADSGSVSPNMDPGYGFPDDVNPSAASGVDADVIVLSDSDDETENRMSSGPTLNPNGTFSEDIVGGSSCLGPFNNDDDDFGVPFWSLPPTSQAGPSFEFFRSDENVHHGLVGPTSMDTFTLTDEIGWNVAAPAGPDSSLYQSVLDVDGGLVDNPLAFGHNDPSLQLFLPTPPPAAAEQVESTINSGVSCAPAPLNGSNVIQQPPPKDSNLDTSADTGTNGKTRSRERSDNPFTFPRQKRSMRPRLYPPR
ncbi:putative chromatin regulator PHD family [Helianthus annuus]|uniref:Putative zinc finger, PHD-type n=1 Tax=Helianthus annuus TaxID=4232 RepID=A0A251SS39_HELAN|nr:putative chromatin regulator PHD family [Helianthus annuus]KAJ0663849.1 putative chromatin regulator PHD family [Helianthus annuus]KAJ0858370.1 putative chromatin regulator PHD family [Helianthus annuus]